MSTNYAKQHQKKIESEERQRRYLELTGRTGLTSDQIASRAGISAATLRNAAAGIANFPAAMLQKVEAVFGEGSK